LFQFQDLLRKRVDLRILFVDFFAQRFQHFFGLVGALREGLRGSVCAHDDSKDQGKKRNGRAMHGLALWHLPAVEASLPGGGQLAFQRFIPNLFRMPERVQKPPMPWGPKQGDGDGPRSPDISRPDTRDLLKKMRKVDPNQSKRYRQRTGQ
jgi:hypothetical protein